jgi:hypothetical protein
LTLYQNRNGSLMNVVYHTALLIPALSAAGVSASDPRLANAIAWLRARGRRDATGLSFDVYGSDVWSTASYLRVLLMTGSPRNDERVQRAVTWLLAEQARHPHPTLTNRQPGAPRIGGWGFQSGEDNYPDCDTTSTVLDALGRALVPDSENAASLPPAIATRVCAAIAAARVARRHAERRRRMAIVFLGPCKQAPRTDHDASDERPLLEHFADGCDRLHTCPRRMCGAPIRSVYRRRDVTSSHCIGPDGHTSSRAGGKAGARIPRDAAMFVGSVVGTLEGELPPGHGIRDLGTRPTG